jgi:hypothetical protein
MAGYLAESPKNTLFFVKNGVFPLCLFYKAFLLILNEEERNSERREYREQAR